MRTFFMVAMILMAVCAGLMLITAFSAADESRSAIHEIEGLIAGVALAVLAGAGYVGAVIDRAMKR